MRKTDVYTQTSSGCTARTAYTSRTARAVCASRTPLSLIVAGSLAGSLALPGVAGADACAWASEDASAHEGSSVSATASLSAPEKDEIVYVKAGATGGTEGVYVVNAFDAGAVETITDTGRYDSLKNLSTTEALEQRNGLITFTTLDDKPFYYQGNLSANTALPWDISVSYFLDGVRVEPDEVAGVSGDLEIKLKIAPVEPADGAGEDGEVDEEDHLSQYAESYFLQAQGSFNRDNFVLEESGDATIGFAGNNTVVACMVMPGDEASYTIRGKARDFEYGGWQISAMPLSMAIDLAEQDTSELTDKTADFSDALGALSEGTSELSRGVGGLAAGADQLAGGAAELSAGADSLAQGGSGLSEGLDAAAQGAQSLSSSWSAISGLISGLNAGVAQAQADASACGEQLRSLQVDAAQNAGVSAARLRVDAACSALAEDPSEVNRAALGVAVEEYGRACEAQGAQDAYAASISAHDEAFSSLRALDGSALDAYVSGFGAGLEEMGGGIVELSAGADQLASGVGQYAQGARAFADGVGQYAQGSAQAADGADQLASGAQTMADAVANMDQEILDELQHTIDEKLGRDFKASSFVDADNENVSSVQFVYLVEGVEKPDDDKAGAAFEADKAEDESFLDRLAALFTRRD